MCLINAGAITLKALTGDRIICKVQIPVVSSDDSPDHCQLFSLPMMLYWFTQQSSLCIALPYVIFHILKKK